VGGDYCERVKEKKDFQDTEARKEAEDQDEAKRAQRRKVFQ